MEPGILTVSSRKPGVIHTPARIVAIRVGGRRTQGRRVARFSGRHRPVIQSVVGDERQHQQHEGASHQVGRSSRGWEKPNVGTG